VQERLTRQVLVALQTLLDTPDVAGALGNYIHLLSPPWWQFTNGPGDFQSEAAPSRIPPARGQGSFEEFARQAERLRETTDCYLLATIYAFNFEKAWMLRGMENLMIDMLAEPEFVEKLFERMLEINRAMLRLLVSVPHVDGFLLGSDWGGQQGLLISPEQWRRYIKHTEKLCYDVVREAGKDLWVHSCGNIEVIIPDLIDMGLEGLNPVQSEVMDLETLKTRFGTELTFWGGVSTQKILPYGSPQEVKYDVERVIEIMSPGGGYVLGPSQSIQEDVPLENILAFLEVARAHG
jgi:uroporphyrinogen decarboxylase